MPTYTLRYVLRPSGSNEGPATPIEMIEARDDTEATTIAQASAGKHGDGLMRAELVSAGGEIVWKLSRGETVSERPRDVP